MIGAHVNFLLSFNRYLPYNLKNNHFETEITL
jgi:hypothetical protein